MAIKAVLVGVNHYKRPWSRLKSCVNDVKDWKKLLHDNYKVSSQNIKILKSRKETKGENILDNLQALVNGLTSKDIGLFVFSGHGSQTTIDIKGKKMVVEIVR